jgi:hypothetical protein
MCTALKLAAASWIALHGATACSSDRPSVAEGPATVAAIRLDLEGPLLMVAGTVVPLGAIPTDRQGTQLPTTALRYETSNPAVVQVDSAGQLQGEAPGEAIVTALGDGSRLDVPVYVAPPHPDGPLAHHVSPDETVGGYGTAVRPFSLQQALRQPATVRAGDTLLLHGGTYRGEFTSQLTGQESASIVLRQAPGERATIDGNLVVRGAYATYWGFEVTSSIAAPADLMAVDVHAPGTRLINLVVHDAGGNGIGMWQESSNAEVYGSIIYNNGRQRVKPGHAHGIYAQNATGTQHFVDNVLFNQFGYGFHLYGEDGPLDGFHLEGNASFENGTPAESRGSVNILVGGVRPASRVTLLRNYTFKRSTDGTNVWLGRDTRNEDVRVQDNFIVGGSPALRVSDWRRAVMRGNVLITPGDVVNLAGTLAGYEWADNTYFHDPTSAAWFFVDAWDLPTWQARTGFDEDRSGGTLPTGTTVVVRPNRYEAGRAHVIIYNWTGASTVDVDLSAVLEPGDRYAIRPVQNLFGSPVASGTYGGGPVSVPMAAYPSPEPVGGWQATPLPTGPQFNVMLVTRE